MVDSSALLFIVVHSLEVASDKHDGKSLVES